MVNGLAHEVIEVCRTLFCETGRLPGVKSDGHPDVFDVADLISFIIFVKEPVFFGIRHSASGGSPFSRFVGCSDV